MDNLHYRLILDLVKKRNSRKEPFKSSKIPKFVERYCKVCIYIALQNLQIFYIIVLRAEIATTFGSKMVTISTRSTKYRKFAKLRKAIFSVLYN